MPNQPNDGTTRARRGRCAPLLIAILVGLLAGTPARQASGQIVPQRFPAVRIVGQLGGECAAIATQGDRILAGEGRNLLILRLPVSALGAELPLLARLPLPDAVQDIVVSGTLALVADGPGGGLQVVNFTDPSKPNVVGSVDTPGYARDVAIAANGLILIADGREGLQTVQTNRLGPPTRREYQPGFEVAAVAAEGNLGFLAGPGGLQVVDVSQVTQVVPVGNLPSTDTIRGIAVSANIAYLAGNEGLWIVDCRSPGKPNVLGLFPEPAKDVAIYGNLAFLVTQAGGMLVLNVAIPQDPSVVNSWYQEMLLPECVFVDFLGRAFLGYRQGDINVLDPQITLLAWWTGLDYVKDVAVSGTLACLADSGWLRLLDVSRPATPIVRGSSMPRGYPEAIALSGPYAYVAEFMTGVEVFDLAGGTSPVLVSQLSASAPLDRIAVADRLVCATGYTSDVQIMDFTDFQKPVMLRPYSVKGAAADVALVKNLAYVAHQGSGELLILDLSQPTAPVLLGSTTVPDSPRRLCVAGRFAYVLSDTGLSIVDVRDPKTPRFLSFLPMTQLFEDLDAYRGYVYLAGQTLAVVNVRDPFKPFLQTSWLDPNPIPALDVQHGLIYLAREVLGLMIVQFTDPAPRIVAAGFTDLNADDAVGAGDLLILSLSRSVTLVSGMVLQRHFYLPVAGDSLGFTGYSIGLNPYNARQLVIRLGANARLTPVGGFTTGSITTGAASGIDFAADFPFGVVMTQDGYSAVGGGVPGVNDVAVDVLYNLASREIAVDRNGGFLNVFASPDAAYTRHHLVFPPGAVATSTTFRLVPPRENLGVVGAVQVESSNPAIRFPVRVMLYTEYHDEDIDWERGFIEGEMRVHQLVEKPAGTFRYVPLPGRHTIVKPPLLGIGRAQEGGGEVAAPIDSLNPADSDGDVSVFAGIPIETVDERAISIKPTPPGMPAKAAGAMLTPGPNGAYTAHAIEFPGYVETLFTDPARTVVTIRMSTLVERFAASGGQSFPDISGAVFTVETANAAGLPVAFAGPVNLTVQFWRRDVQSDTVKFDNTPSDASAMRLVKDVGADDEVDFAFVNVAPQTVNVLAGTVAVPNVAGLTGSDGRGVFGVVGGDSAQAERWSLYR